MQYSHWQTFEIPHWKHLELLEKRIDHFRTKNIFSRKRFRNT